MCQENAQEYENKIEALEIEKEELESKIDDIYSHLKTLHYTINTLMSVSFSDLKVVYNTILGLASNFVEANKGLLLVFQETNDRLTVEAVKDLAQDLAGKVSFSNKNKIIARIIKNKKIDFIEQIEEVKEDSEESVLKELLTNSFLAVPLVSENQTIGLIILMGKIGGEEFSEEDIKFLTAYSTMALSTINNARLLLEIKEKERLEQELTIARHIQTALLPQIPQIQGMEIEALMEPAEEVGGDFYDFMQGKDGRNWFAIGDVSSHGVTPGLIMMMAQSIFSTMISQSDNKLTPKDVVVGINNVLYNNIRERLKDDDYMTLVILAYDGKGSFVFAGAHEEMIIYRAKTKKCEMISTSGLWVGMVEELIANTENSSFSLEKDDVLLLYTDGIIQGRNEESEQYDMERLEKCLTNNAHKSVTEIKENIWKEVSSWILDQEDDITMVVIKKK